MAQSLSKILIHLVYSTKNRGLLLPKTPYLDLHKYAHGMNNVADHVHVLFELHRTEALSNVVMHVKKGTSRWLKEQSSNFDDFDWQEGYGAFSIGRSQREDVGGYIRNQQTRHRRISFQDEFRKLLVSYEIEYDERYVWA